MLKVDGEWLNFAMKTMASFKEAQAAIDAGQHVVVFVDQPGLRVTGYFTALKLEGNKVTTKSGVFLCAPNHYPIFVDHDTDYDWNADHNEYPFDFQMHEIEETPKQKLIKHMKANNITVYPYMEAEDDPELRAYQLISAFERELSCRETIAINTGHKLEPSRLLKPLVQRTAGGNYVLSPLGEYVARYMPIIAG